MLSTTLRVRLSRAASTSWVAAAITLALGLTTPWPVPALLWPAVAVVVLVGLNFFRPFTLSRRGVLGLALMMALATYLCRFPLLVSTVKGLYAGFRDHRRLEDRLPIFPQRLWGERPQRLLIYAPHSQRLTVSLEGKAWNADHLGSGVFRWDYDPHKQPPLGGNLVSLSLASDGDGSRVVEMPYVAPMVRPGLLSSDLASGRAAMVSEMSDEVIVAERGGELRRWPVEDGPSACALLEGGERVLVGHRYHRSVWLMEARTGRRLASRELPGGVESLAVSPDEKCLAVLYEGGLAWLGLPNLEVLERFSLADPGEFVCFGRDSSELIVASRRHRSLTRWTRGRATATGRLPLARPATALARGFEGRRIYIAATSGKVDGSQEKGDHYVKDVILGLDLESWKWTTRVATEDRRDVQKLAGSIDSGCGAVDLKFVVPNDLLVAFSGTHEVARMPLGDGLDQRWDLSAEGLLCPGSVADLGQGVELVSYPAQAKLVWLNAQGKVLRVAELGGEFESQRRQGEICFYEATNAGISCQSCHPRGDSDYANHNLSSVKPWGTLSLQGVADTAPYLRAAPYPSLPDLHSVADTEFRGFRRQVSFDRADATARFIEDQPLPTNPRQLLPPDPAQAQAERRGLQVYIKAGCNQCHTFPATTNLAVVPNQVLFPPPEGPNYYEAVDVPSLRALWRSAPYLHDARAATLEDILGKTNPHDQHGRTSRLSASERSDLLEFLLSL